MFHRGPRPESEQGVPAVLGMDGDVWEPREEGRGGISGGGRRRGPERSRAGGGRPSGIGQSACQRSPGGRPLAAGEGQRDRRARTDSGGGARLVPVALLVPAARGPHAALPPEPRSLLRRVPRLPAAQNGGQPSGQRCRGRRERRPGGRGRGPLPKLPLRLPGVPQPPAFRAHGAVRGARQGGSCAALRAGAPATAAATATAAPVRLPAPGQLQAQGRGPLLVVLLVLVLLLVLVVVFPG